MDAFGGTLILDEADLPYSDARADLVKIFNNGTVKGMPVLRTVQNRNKEFNPAAFKVFGPKVIAMRHSFEDPALESRFLTEETGTRPLRSDIPVHLPASLRAEALELRNRLLHFRLCEFFKIKTDTAALIEGIEPRLNQTALSLLSLIDDAELRIAVQKWLLAQNDDTLAARRETDEARVVAAASAAFAAADGKEVSVGEIARCFNDASDEDNEFRSAKWVGYMLRSRLRFKTRKSHGVFVVPASEKPKLDASALRFGIDGAF
jgi:hypothetical protein